MMNTQPRQSPRSVNAALGILSCVVVVASMAAGPTSRTAAASDDTKPVPDPALTIQIGEEMPDLVYGEVRGAPEGQEFTRKALKGKVVVLEFWGPYCVPCIAAFPHINSLVKTFRDEPVVFISVADQSYNGCRKVLAKHPLKTWQFYGDKPPVFDLFGVNAMPRTVIIDREGRVVAYSRPKKLTEEVIRAVLEGKDVPSHYDASEFTPPEQNEGDGA